MNNSTASEGSMACETAVLRGEIDHRDSLLSEDEQAAMNTMMICVSRCRGSAWCWISSVTD
ncbi:MAG TPA: hypothetical protein VGN49_02195 [Micrococcaceae bacterium]|nr:hypothetical protein [Micrococcaceae bacterium]